MHSLAPVRECMVYCLLIFIGTTMNAQDRVKENEKKNPEPENLQIVDTVENSAQSTTAANKQKLPAFDLPEYIITGVGSSDIQNVDKVSIDDTTYLVPRKIKSTREDRRDRQSLENEIMSGKVRQQDGRLYTGMIKGGMGSYFSPQASVWFGQTSSRIQYDIGGMYFLTKGFKENTDKSEGSITADGKMSLLSDGPLFHNSIVNAAFLYKSESFRLYGSVDPHLQRTLSEFNLNVGIENQASSIFPYTAKVTFNNFRVADSSSSVNQSCIDVFIQSPMTVSSLPFQLKFYGMLTQTGIGFLDVSGGIQNYWYGGVEFNGALHIYGAKGQEGQQMIRIRPHIKILYPMTKNHSIYAVYDPQVAPLQLESIIRVNKYLSADSRIKHSNITQAGEVGLESEWNENLSSRVSFGVKTIDDLAMFSDSSRQGIWTTMYGGEATIATFSAEMVAKFNPNDYFASNVILRSTKNSFLNTRIPYFPVIEAGCSISHYFGRTIVASIGLRFVGDRQADLMGKSTVSRYLVVDASSDYRAFDFLKFSLEIKNLTNTKYSVWRGYQEFPITIQLSAQVKW